MKKPPGVWYNKETESLIANLRLTIKYNKETYIYTINQSPHSFGEDNMTIYDIAKLAGVSASSVSRVINNKPGVGKETREKILALLDQYHYSLDETARGLSKKSSKTIGVLISVMPGLHSEHSIKGLFYMEGELANHGYHCLLVNTGTTDGEVVEAISTVAGRRVDGVILAGAFYATNVVRRAIEQYLPQCPVVMINGFLDLPNVYGVGIDETQGLEMGVDFLVRKGRSKLALFIDSRRLSAGIIRRGFENGIAKYRGAVTGIVYEDVERSLQGGRDTAALLLREHPETDGIICAVDMIAIGVLDYLQEMGIDVPGQVSLMGEDNSNYAEICKPKLTSLDTKMVESNLMAVRTLLDVLEQRPPCHRVMLYMEIAERGTT